MARHWLVSNPSPVAQKSSTLHFYHNISCQQEFYRWFITPRGLDCVTKSLTSMHKVLYKNFGWSTICPESFTVLHGTSRQSLHTVSNSWLSVCVDYPPYRLTIFSRTHQSLTMASWKDISVALYICFSNMHQWKFTMICSELFLFTLLQLHIYSVVLNKYCLILLESQLPCCLAINSVASKCDSRQSRVLTSHRVHFRRQSIEFKLQWLYSLAFQV
jgi:hypothetical protein